jgi:FtsZ-binding cell division protein ZapB
MSKKRFIYDGLYIRDTLNEIPSILTHNDNQRDKFLNGLNYLSEENEQLKHDATVLICSNQEYRKENKQFQEKIFTLIDKKIREYSNLEQRERTSSDTITILKELKKELEK